MLTPQQEHPPAAPRWELIRDLAVLQVKLIVDGFRDLVLLPASIVAALISIMSSEKGVPGPQFYDLLAFGKKTEHWINLFGALQNSPHDMNEASEQGNLDIDTIVRKVETFVVAEYQSGGVTAQAKSRIDAALKKMRNKKRPGDGGAA